MILVACEMANHAIHSSRRQRAKIKDILMASYAWFLGSLSQTLPLIGHLTLATESN